MTLLMIIWFILIVVLWIGYVALEGFGFGVGMLLKPFAKNERERRALINSIGPHWDGNEVWLLTAGGATFAAFPEWYATMFSGMYIALVAVLLCLIIRICALEWRKMIRTEKWRGTWDMLHCVVSWVVTILFGVAFANFVQGMAIEVGSYESGSFVAVAPGEVVSSLATNHHFLTGGFFSLLTPFTILGGLVVMSLCLSHGALWISIKVSGDLQKRAMGLAKKTTLVSTGLTAVWALWAYFVYSNQVLAIIPLAICAILLIATVYFTWMNRDGLAFGLHFAGIAFAVATIFSMIFPYAMRSYIDDAYSLTIEQATATAPTQGIMLVVAIVFVPIVLAYTFWAYYMFRKRIDVGQIPEEPVGLEPRKIRQFEVK
ncbi:cytochrome d ubiquinol oxidase subunit II [Actinotignum urinale]|uniref:Cytochrome d ubiquinol oxidase subunit II n=1 Tax=Actinotignum urinale TaxID=190146 RepID=A0AAW9HUC8_9ACTO|nr:cytochrome d ubiquinol oxidase subunit II [Actinotignum urinale]MDY5129605.1 cytochrome d ubiquinol oxidase subunit II [Actinotignum urinale]MDY5155323.1 cytochrome d ubiquinol oxidase subunit II [Actinotignum urinale]WIK58821.1 cytochrome d ubiquinol oxidase subunit II [Actinotignum urinale]